MVMFLLSFVKGVQIRGGESISASGFGPGGPILGGSKSAGTAAVSSVCIDAVRMRLLWLSIICFVLYIIKITYALCAVR